MLRTHDPAIGHGIQERNSISGRARYDVGLKRLSGERRQHLSSRGPSESSNLLDRPQHVVVEIQCCSHTSNITHHASPCNRIRLPAHRKP